MPEQTMTRFCKNEDCPASDELLSFQNGGLDQARAGHIRRHLRSCEFCEAEAAFYSRYPQTDPVGDQVEIGEIPAPLYELAEALLKHRHTDAKTLNALMKEKEGLLIT
jgi:hypothetical protein